MAIESASATQVTTADEAEVFIGVTPFRLVDTRTGTGVDAPGPLSAGASMTVSVTKSADIPASATSVAFNTTFPSSATSPSFMTIWPTGTPRPFTAVNNATPGEASPNFVVSKLSADGSVDVYNERGDAHIVLDVAGYYVPLSSVEAEDTPGGALWAGTGEPSNFLGTDGDFYIEETEVVMYGPKADGSWGIPLAEFGKLADGPGLVSGDGAPSESDGDVDDLYFDLAAPAVYGPKTDAGWGAPVDVGPDGVGSVVHVEARPPTPADGTDGDIFLDETALDLYGPKTSGAWGTPVSFDPGSRFLTGVLPPTAGEGGDGDLYIDTATLTVYGPKAGGAWPPVGTELNPGIDFLSGSGAPGAGDGEDGDIYLDLDTLTLYGPKVGGVWPGTGTDLDGPPTAASDSALNAYSNNLTVTLTGLASPVPIEFDTDGVSVGGAISRVPLQDDTFVFNTSGTYKVTYAVDGIATVGSYAVHVDGSAVAGHSMPAAALAPSTGVALVQATAGDELQVVLTGTAVVAAGIGSSLVVELIAVD